MEPEYIYVTTTGWKSGKPHTIEIWFVEHAGCYYMISEMGEKSHWVQNIRRNPAIHLRVGELEADGTGRVVDREAEPELAAAVAQKMEQKYDWSTGLMVELKP